MTSDQHAERVRASLDWFDSPALNPDKCLSALINEYFYASLHMLEAVLFDFYPSLTAGVLPAPVHGFDEHSARNDFLRKVAVQPYKKSRGKGFGSKHKLDAMAAPYQALYRLSRRAISSG